MKLYREYPEIVRVTIELPASAVAVLETFCRADCWAHDTELVPLPLYLSWWITDTLGSWCSGCSVNERYYFYQDCWGTLHRVPAHDALPKPKEGKEGGPGDWVNGRPWWLARPAARRWRGSRPGFLSFPVATRLYHSDQRSPPLPPFPFVVAPTSDV
jgi:hypothetical protein